MVSSFRTPLIDTDDDFTEMLRRFKLADGIGALVEGENVVDYRLQSVPRDGAVHRLEHHAGTDVNPAHGEHFMEDVSNLDLARNAGQDTDQADVTGVACGTQGLREGAFADDCHDEVDAASLGYLQDALAPFRLGPVIDRVMGAHRPGALQLGVTAGNQNNRCAGHFAELQSEERNAACALQ